MAKFRVIAEELVEYELCVEVPDDVVERLDDGGTGWVAALLRRDDEKFGGFCAKANERAFRDNGLPHQFLGVDEREVRRIDRIAEDAAAEVYQPSPDAVEGVLRFA